MHLLVDSRQLRDQFSHSFNLRRAAIYRFTHSHTINDHWYFIHACLCVSSQCLLGKIDVSDLFFGRMLCTGISSSNSQGLGFAYSHSVYRVSFSDVSVVLFWKCINVSSVEKLCLATDENRQTIDGVNVINRKIEDGFFEKI